MTNLSNNLNDIFISLNIPTDTAIHTLFATMIYNYISPVFELPTLVMKFDAKTKSFRVRKSKSF